MLAHEAYVWMKEVTTSNSRVLVKVAAANSRKFVLPPLESSQISHAYVQKYSVVRRLATSILYGSLAHQATD